MEFGLTTAVQKRLKIEKTLSVGQETDARFCWEVNLTKLQNKNVLIIVHASSRYCVFCANMNPSFWKNLDSSLRDVVSTAMMREGFSEQETEAYFSKAGELRITKTHGKKSVGGMNRITSDLPYYLGTLDTNLLQVRLMEAFNDNPATTAFHPEYKCIIPNDYFRNEIRNLLYGEEMKLEFAMVKGGTIRNGILEKYENGRWIKGEDE